MKHRRLADALGIAALFVAAVVVLGWLLLGLDGTGGHRVALPDGASSVETLAADHAVRSVEEAAALPADAWRPAPDQGFIERGSDHAA